jgi:hypothetical protein
MQSHKWTKYVKRLLNLDSMSPFGKEVFFRCSPSVLSNEYVVPYPHSSVIGNFKNKKGEEIMGLLSSYTDYSVFVNESRYGNMPYQLNAMDFAYYQLGIIFNLF